MGYEKLIKGNLKEKKGSGKRSRVEDRDLGQYNGYVTYYFWRIPQPLLVGYVTYAIHLVTNRVSTTSYSSLKVIRMLLVKPLIPM